MTTIYLDNLYRLWFFLPILAKFFFIFQVFIYIFKFLVLDTSYFIDSQQLRMIIKRPFSKDLLYI